MSTEPWELTATELLDGYRSGTISPIEVLSSVQARLDAVNPAINAIVAQYPNAARAQAAASAARWQSGEPLSVLDGIPITIKDNLWAAGLPATWGSKLYAGFVPATDEAPVRRLRAAGAVFVGKTNVPEFTLQGHASNLVFGTTRNPHAPRHDSWRIDGWRSGGCCGWDRSDRHRDGWRRLACGGQPRIAASMRSSLPSARSHDMVAFRKSLQILKSWVRLAGVSRISPRSSLSSRGYDALRSVLAFGSCPGATFPGTRADCLSAENGICACRSLDRGSFRCICCSA